MTEDVQTLHLPCPFQGCEIKYYYHYFQDIKLSELHFRLAVQELEHHKREQHFLGTLEV